LASEKSGLEREEEIERERERDETTEGESAAGNLPVTTLGNLATGKVFYSKIKLSSLPKRQN